MKQSLRIVLLLAASMPVAAYAADYDPPIFVEEADEYVPVEVGSGWYLRGDVGYVFDSGIDGVDYTAFDPIASADVSASFTSASIDTDFTWGGGFGYRFTDYFRADATVDGFRADFDGSTSSARRLALDDPRRRHDLPIGKQLRGFRGQRHGQWLCRSRHLCRLHALCRRRRRHVLCELDDLNDTTYCVDGAVDFAPTGGAVGGIEPSRRKRLALHLRADGRRRLRHQQELQARRRLQIPQHRRRRHVRLGLWPRPLAMVRTAISTRTRCRLGLRYELW